MHYNLPGSRMPEQQKQGGKANGRTLLTKGERIAMGIAIYSLFALQLSMIYFPWFETFDHLLMTYLIIMAVNIMLLTVRHFRTAESNAPGWAYGYVIIAYLSSFGMGAHLL